MQSNIIADKSLGQNFLFDDAVLHRIADYAELTPNDEVLEIGPGLGTLTTKLCDRAGHVTAVEFDRRLAPMLLQNIAKWNLEYDGLKREPENVKVINQDFLQYDLSQLPRDYKVFATVELGIKVSAEMFIPAPKVDSQVVIMHRRKVPLVPYDQQVNFFAMVRAGFSEKRKKLRSSLAVGLQTTKENAERLLNKAGIDPNKRAQELSIDDWLRLLDS